MALSCLRSRWPPSGQVSPFLVPVYVSLPLAGRGSSHPFVDVPLALLSHWPIGRPLWVESSEFPSGLRVLAAGLGYTLSGLPLAARVKYCV